MDVVKDHIAWMEQDINRLLRSIPQAASTALDPHEQLLEIRQEIDVLRHLIGRYEQSGLIAPEEAELLGSGRTENPTFADPE